MVGSLVHVPVTLTQTIGVVRPMSLSHVKPSSSMCSKRMVGIECIRCAVKGNTTRTQYIRMHGKEVETSQDGPEPEQTAGVRAALKLLVMYKTVISPLLPPSCRFQPTCSAYAMDAYTEYGVGKGTIMTAWRIVRCTPWGGSGYDPAVWPPPGLEWLDT